MSITAWIAVLVIIATIYCLIKRYETRLVLFTAGLFLCCISMKPMAALDQFAKSMTKDRKSTRLNSSHLKLSRMPSSA